MFVVEREDFALFLIRSFLLGVFLASLYLAGGFFRIFLEGIRSARGKNLCLFVPDLAFCLLSAFLNVLLIFSANRGQVRPIALILEASGFFLVLRVLGKRAYRMEKRLLCFLKKRVLIPLVLPLRRLCHKIEDLLKKRVQTARFFRFNKDLDRKLIKRIRYEVAVAEEQSFGGLLKTDGYARDQKKKKRKDKRK